MKGEQQAMYNPNTDTGGFILRDLLLDEECPEGFDPTLEGEKCISEQW